jgi:hypothetical protein
MHWVDHVLRLQDGHPGRDQGVRRQAVRQRGSRVEVGGCSTRVKTLYDDGDSNANA